MKQNKNFITTKSLALIGHVGGAVSREKKFHEAASNCFECGFSSSVEGNASRLIAANWPRTNQSCFLIDSFVDQLDLRPIRFRILEIK